MTAHSILTPVLSLIIWTLIVWCWMYATRIPAMKRAGVDPQSAVHPGSLTSLPSETRVVADNYNHLHEQPTLFYALAIYSHLAGVADPLNIWLAWAYVGLRAAHSLAQIVLRRVIVRFSLFALSSLVLVAMALRNLWALF
ncbi:MAG: MAPEG family protein [Pseudomonadota bacterium]